MDNVTDQTRVLREAAQAVVDQASDYYTARNGRRMSIEGDDGEKCWIIWFDPFEDLRRALAAAPATPHTPAPAIGVELPETLAGHWWTEAGREMAMRALDDPHMQHNRERQPDMQLANDVFLSPGIGNLTAAKERIRWLSARLAALTTPAPAQQSEVEAYQEALQTIANGEEPRPLGTRWRADGKDSKNDKCVHDEWMYDTCGNCIADFAATALTQPNTLEKGNG